MKNPAVYIMANKKNGTIYTGVTSDLVKRVYEHKNSIIKGFTSKYNCKLLVFFEMHHTIVEARSREWQIKSYVRRKKLTLIEGMNAGWDDLASDWF